MVLYIYCWCAYRFHVLSSSRPISGKALKAQFGCGYGRQDNFARKFVESLKLAMAVYPASGVDVDERGLVLHPSGALVAPTMAAVR